MAKRRVVVTGLGMLTPLGNDVASSWQGLQQAQSGISLIEHFDTSAYTTKFAGLVKNFDVEPYFPAKDAKKIAFPNTTEGRRQPRVVYLVYARAANWGLGKTQQLQAAGSIK